MPRCERWEARFDRDLAETTPTHGFGIYLASDLLPP
jgi:hypothetical protein